MKCIEAKFEKNAQHSLSTELSLRESEGGEEL